MKLFLLKVFIFFTLVVVGLMLLYHAYDGNDQTIGDYRYVKVRNFYLTKRRIDAIIIGSSRVINIGDTTALNLYVFNFGILGGMPDEYAGYIRFAVRNKPIRKVIVALDFYGSSISGLKGINDFGVSIQAPEVYIKEVKSETVFSAFLTQFDFSRFKRLLNKIFFRTDFQKERQPENHTWVKKQWEIYENAYSHFKFNEDLPKIYSQIKESAGDAEIVVFLTPISAPLFELLQQHKLEAEYRRFIRTSVSSFGEVYNFMEINTFTSSPKNFIDENHTTNERLYEMIEYVLGDSTQTEVKATLLNSNNIDSYIADKHYLKIDNDID